jgi:hypothetical protein
VGQPGEHCYANAEALAPLLWQDMKGTAMGLGGFRNGRGRPVTQRQACKPGGPFHVFDLRRHGRFGLVSMLHNDSPQKLTHSWFVGKSMCRCCMAVKSFIATGEIAFANQ